LSVSQHPHLFNLESGHSGLGLYTTQRDAAQPIRHRRLDIRAKASQP
jgi:hypothetical protein